MNIGKRITTLRKANKLNQKELSEKINLNRSVLNRIELGTRPVRDDELKTFASFFNVSTDFLVGNAPNSVKTPAVPIDIIRLALKDHPDVLKAIESADFATNTINLGDATINIDDIDLDYIKTSILSAIVMAKQKGENGKLEITVSPKAKLPDT